MTAFLDNFNDKEKKDKKCGKREGRPLILVMFLVISLVKYT